MDNHQPENHQPLAYHDDDFLESTDARPLRLLAEYLEPLRRFRQENIQDTVVFFGSARVDSREVAESALKKLKAAKGSELSAHLAALERGRKAVEWSRYYEDARLLANKLTEWSLSLEAPRRRFVVCSGGGPGIMEAANRGAHEAGGEDHRAQHPTSPSSRRTQPVHHRRSALRVPLFLHAEVLVRVSGEVARDLSRRVRHARRDVRDPHAVADRKLSRSSSSSCTEASLLERGARICGRSSTGERLTRRTWTFSAVSSFSQEAFEELKTFLMARSHWCPPRRRKTARPESQKPAG